MNYNFEIGILALLVAINASLPGLFLVLRGVAMMSDAISHAVLFGIAVLFLYTQNLNSPLLLLGAALSGLLTVFGVEILINTQRIKKDAAIGLIFPFLFSVGVIIISTCARNVHLDTDMVLLGEITFAPFSRLLINGIDCGPYALWIMSIILTINMLFVSMFYKELVLTIFDPKAAILLGFSPTLLYYLLMGLTSITAVASFNIVGSVVIIALMIIPPATAYLLTTRLYKILAISCLISCSSALLGCIGAYQWNVSIAGMISTVSGCIFAFVIIGQFIRGRSYTCFFKKNNNS
jgi:manganese/zinc/iron transport system permease protein